ncbi:MAG: hypothetical protein ACRBBW_00845 [Cellvibrionaceae bacterium]
MTISNSLQVESVLLQNRIGRLIPVNIQCLFYNGRYSVILQATPDLPARQMSKSAEQLAHQVIQKLAVDPASVDFFQCQPGEEPEWLRWSFQWVGQSPLHGKNYSVNPALEERILKPLLEKGETFSINAKSIPCVA